MVVGDQPALGFATVIEGEGVKYSLLPTVVFAFELVHDPVTGSPAARYAQEVAFSIKHRPAPGKTPITLTGVELIDNRPTTKDERPTTGDYNPSMLDENMFRKHGDAAIESLKQSLIEAEESADFEVEDQAGALYIGFEDGTRFVISPNAPVRQVWISALATSFKLDWSEADQEFVLAKTGEKLKPLVARLVNQQLGEEAVKLS